MNKVISTGITTLSALLTLGAGAFFLWPATNDRIAIKTEDYISCSETSNSEQPSYCQDSNKENSGDVSFCIVNKTPITKTPSSGSHTRTVSFNDKCDGSLPQYSHNEIIYS